MPQCWVRFARERGETEAAGCRKLISDSQTTTYDHVPSPDADTGRPRVLPNGLKLALAGDVHSPNRLLA
jgi:hypothetical protein